MSKREITNDELAKMIKQGFDGVDEKFEKAKKDRKDMKKNIEDIKEDVFKIKQDMSGLKQGRLKEVSTELLPIELNAIAQIVEKRVNASLKRELQKIRKELKLPSKIKL